MGRRSIVAGLVVVLSICGLLRAESPDVALAGAGAAESVPPVNLAPQPTLGRIAEELPDPLAFFQKLVDRYRRLTTYRDTAQIVEITQREGEAPKRVEKRIACEIDGGELQVTTPARQLLRRLGLMLPIESTPKMDAARQQYDRWLAPHMTMKYAEEPLQDFRPGVEQGFTATEVGPVIIDRKDMVHLKLESGDGGAEECDATFDLFVDPDSMLIERIEGEQQLSDGADYQTTIDIDPEDDAISEADGPKAAPPPVDSPPKDAPPDDVPPVGAPPADLPPADAPPVSSPPKGDGAPPDEAQGDSEVKGEDGAVGSQIPKPAKLPATSSPVTAPPRRPGKPKQAPPVTDPESGRSEDDASGPKTVTPPKSPGKTAGGRQMDMFRLR